MLTNLNEVKNKLLQQQVLQNTQLSSEETEVLNMIDKMGADINHISNMVNQHNSGILANISIDVSTDICKKCGKKL